MKSWCDRVRGPPLAKLIVPRTLLATVGSSSSGCSRQIESSSGLARETPLSDEAVDDAIDPRAGVEVVVHEVVDPVHPERATSARRIFTVNGPSLV